MFPVLFLSHGAPNTILKETITKKSLRALKKSLGKPNYILIISSHWITQDVEIINPHANKLMYDFYGFEQALYEFKYKISSSPEMTEDIVKKLPDLKIHISDSRRAFDHGVWSVLSMIYETLKIPVIQMSLPLWDATKLFEYGEQLKKLRDEALIICSGSITHNLYDMEPHFDAPVKEYAKVFNEKIKNALKEGNKTYILNHERMELFAHNHPTSEHYMPLIIALGASGNHIGESVNSEFSHSNISMESFIFKG
ncbi:MAG: DODA-type extradiol aromatic ring-opening family dioxygenase [Candidatus Marinarcus sp.]|uniref:DODA-type extradiol aromatic ring-opening family dioxygenase n=1 Tax=Candidatus Marinarcus sp. TaxID=3100987 RepID=UPI003AFF77D2